ncbi:hypothetical protein [Arthrobacter sp. TS-15]|uniref:hypothetical protein n=1 Tax=Arthrobacter sp. TS-15 TaxID=2510797 RepID=UPI001357138D|nr:hypothetical protein [Arthrobacter sp. TS-15]
MHNDHTNASRQASESNDAGVAVIIRTDGPLSSDELTSLPWIGLHYTDEHC